MRGRDPGEIYRSASEVSAAATTTGSDHAAQGPQSPERVGRSHLPLECRLRRNVYAHGRLERDQLQGVTEAAGCLALRDTCPIGRSTASPLARPTMTGGGTRGRWGRRLPARPVV